jgi:hypothetical protein
MWGKAMAERSETVWSQALTKYGLATVLALALTWFLAQRVDGALVRIEHAMEAHIRTTELQQQDQRFYLRAICLNTSTTEAQRSGCSFETSGRDR